MIHTALLRDAEMVELLLRISSGVRIPQQRHP
ncbi:hypothetical protein MUK42_03480 [Musa troglodytarum]|uniref:Uncharacterized protein n=1 Tax=Musa troglodytarum TaxID=320322 RepID=A0A9E7H0L5_9LILI|nr:hypothetical protein MUK42_03480 [Musa troglodytarum]